MITVTYGQRWTLLEQVLVELLSNHPAVCDIIIVDNASNEDISEKVKLLEIDEAYRPKIKVVTLEQNTGSANGFKIGIKTALGQTKADFLWFLDDDNKPAEDSLERLLLAYQILGSVPNNVLLSFRKNHLYLVQAAVRGKNTLISPNSFLGFHIKDSLEKILNRLSKKGKARVNEIRSFDPGQNQAQHPLTLIDLAPYGGLLLHKSWIDRVGYPNERLFLYADDLEFTNRITSSGGRIYLCATSVVEDLESSWSNEETQASWSWISSNSDPMRVYYTVRNTTYLERQHYVSFPLVYWINVNAYLLILAIYSMWKEGFSHTIKRLKLIVRAVRDGIAVRGDIRS